LQISDGGGIVSASIPYNGSMTLRMPSYTPPTGTTITGISLRAGYDAKNASGSSAPQFVVKTTGGTTICGATTVNGGSGQQANGYDVTSCLKPSIGSQFDVTWNARGSGSCSGSSCPQLDGIQVVIDLGLANAANQSYLIPENGCITSSANFWYGTGSPDCAVLRSDATFSTSLSSRLGRMSIKGTVYAPSAAMDIDDTDVYYPIAGRGIIVRHLRIRGFQAHSGYGTPAFSNWLDKSQTARAVVFFACAKSSGTCTSSEAVGRAAVTFDADTQTPTIKNWSTSKS
jgi:hypothetical protein